MRKRAIASLKTGDPPTGRRSIAFYGAAPDQSETEEDDNAGQHRNIGAEDPEDLHATLKKLVTEEEGHHQTEDAGRREQGQNEFSSLRGHTLKLKLIFPGIIP
ncbi:hypothetical protein [Candidatus Manganitrophus noduliformans]|uniref:Uncharacterized protein n=1 Tax=Candidatus Manganitrophus noduliformans TaxID=2606439 RepID=A0A7X6DL66_9BACT|nr:hypothetical protein [Candidatus Manganitrophus noduliformans]NKE69223.1 hypothetical protein [Candidatus Manganitrophus noduliformans]